MAKKHSKKSTTKKSTKKLGLDLLLLILSAGTFGLLALPYVKYEVSSVLGSTQSTTSGYELLNFEANSGVATVILLLIIFASLLILMCVLKMLVDCGVVKNSMAGKIASFGTVCVAFAVLVMTIVNIIVIPSSCSAGGFGSYFSAGSYAGWLGLILTLVLGLGDFVVSVFSVKK